jgi:hypothetical protein
MLDVGRYSRLLRGAMIETSKTRTPPEFAPSRPAPRRETGIATLRLSKSSALRINLKILAAVAFSLLLWAAIAIILFI